VTATGKARENFPTPVVVYIATDELPDDRDPGRATPP
jgi:hypothetical protein